MAQYITAPDFSYEPLPMDKYVQFAKEQAAAYEGTLNQAYSYLDKLPILDGGLRTEGWAPALRQQYGSEVNNAIDNFVNTKDRRALARELCGISQRLKTDNDVLVNNYDAKAASPTMQLFQSQPNGANAFTHSGTMAPVNRRTDADGNIIEENNLIQFERGATSIQDAERSYNDYVGAFDLQADTDFMAKEALFNTIQRQIGDGTITQDPATGLLSVKTDTETKTYNNILDLVQDETGEYYQGSKQAIDQLEVEWNNRTSDSVRAYQYQGKDFNDFVNDAFAVNMPKLHKFDRATTTSIKNSSKGNSGKVTPTETLAELIIDPDSVDAFKTQEIDFETIFSEAERTEFNKLAEQARGENLTVPQILEGGWEHSDRFIELSGALQTKQMAKALIDDPVNAAAIEEANDAWDQRYPFGDSSKPAQGLQDWRTDEAMLEWYTSIGTDLGLYGQDEIFGLNVNSYDWANLTRWADGWFEPDFKTPDYVQNRSESPVALQHEIFDKYMPNFGPGLDGTFPMVTDRSVDLLLQAKADGADNVTSVKNWANENIQPPAGAAPNVFSFFGGESAALMRENLTYKEARERGLVDDKMHEIFLKHQTDTAGIGFPNKTELGTANIGPDALRNRIRRRRDDNPVQSEIIKETTRFEVIVPKTMITPSAQARADFEKTTNVVKRELGSADVGSQYDIYAVFAANEDSEIEYGLPAMAGSGYNHMMKITDYVGGGQLGAVFNGRGKQAQGAETFTKGILAGVGVNQQSGLLMSVTAMDTIDKELEEIFTTNKATDLFIVPKSEAAKEKVFSFIDDYRSTMGQKQIQAYARGGLMGTGVMTGETIRDLVETANKFNVFGQITPINSQKALKQQGVSITNSYLNPTEKQNMGFVATFDPFRASKNILPGQEGVSLNEVYAAKHEEGNNRAWTWEEYYSNRTDDSPILVEEALLTAFSQQLSEDYTEVDTFRSLTTSIQTSAKVNAKGHSYLTLREFKDLFKEAGLPLNLQKGILFGNKIDLAAFVSKIDPKTAFE